MAEPRDHGGACAYWKKAKQVYRETVEEVANGAGISAEEASVFVGAALVLVLFAVAGVVCFVVTLAVGGRAQILYLVPAVLVAVILIVSGMNRKDELHGFVTAYTPTPLGREVVAQLDSGKLRFY